MKKRHAFVLGALIGGAATLFLTPKTGKQMQTDLLKKVEDLQNKLNQFDQDELKDSLIQEVDRLKSTIQHYDWQASKAELESKFNEMVHRIDDLKEVVQQNIELVPTKLGHDDILEDNEMLETLQELEDLEELEKSEK
ncbi:MAG TPA: YtxH domain-containing protein [Firmicutes bacterium]|nr:YtxH domain-containing protein [Bacillota bacterium]